MTSRSGRRRGPVALMLVWVAAAAVVLTQASVGGEWTITLNTQTGETVWSATLEQDGAELSGEIDLGNREILPIEGAVDGDSISLAFIVPDADGDMPINLSGAVEGDVIKGDEGSFVWFGSGDWTGTKRGP